MGLSKGGRARPRKRRGRGVSRSLYKGGRGESPFFSLHAVPPFPFNARRRLLGHRLSRPPPTAIGSLPALLRPHRPLVAVRRARSASPPTSSPSRRALRRRRLGPFASAPPSPPLPPPSTRPACFASPPRQSRHALAREGIEKARVSKGARHAPEPHRACPPTR